MAVSADSMTASLPSKMALATSLASARVGRGFALFTIFFVASVIGGLLLMFAIFVLRETIYALKDLATKPTKGDQENQAGN